MKPDRQSVVLGRDERLVLLTELFRGIEPLAGLIAYLSMIFFFNKTNVKQNIEQVKDELDLSLFFLNKK